MLLICLIIRLTSSTSCTSSTSVHKLYAPGLEYSRCLTRFHVSRTTLSCASRAVSVSVGPAGLEAVSGAHGSVRRLGVPDGEIEPAAQLRLGNDARVFWGVRHRHQTPGLLEDGKSCSDVPVDTVISIRAPFFPGKSRLHLPLPATTLPPDIEGPHGCVSQIQRGTVRRGQQVEPMRTWRRPRLTSLDSSCRAPCRPFRLFPRAQQPCS